MSFLNSTSQNDNGINLLSQYEKRLFIVVNEGSMYATAAALTRKESNGKSASTKYRLNFNQGRTSSQHIQLEEFCIRICFKNVPRSSSVRMEKYAASWLVRNYIVGR